MKDFLIIITLSSLVTLALSADANEWKKKAIYQLMTDRFATTDNPPKECDVTLMNYCGGNHQGLINKLDYIEDMGFDAIWISPIVKNAEGSYHGYHTIDFYDLNEHFGTKQDMLNLVQKCHDKDIKVMLDVVANHVGLV